jgi:Type IV secretion system pilin
MDATKVIQLFQNGITFLQLISGAVCLFFFIWGAVMYATAGMSFERAREGKEGMIKAVAGLALVLIGGTILQAVINGLGSNVTVPVN